MIINMNSIKVPGTIDLENGEERVSILKMVGDVLTKIIILFFWIGLNYL